MSVLHPVKVIRQVLDWDAHRFSIELNDEGFALIEWTKDVNYPIALCDNAKALSDWALAKGARAVDWPGATFLASEGRP